MTNDSNAVPAQSCNSRSSVYGCVCEKVKGHDNAHSAGKHSWWSADQLIARDIGACISAEVTKIVEELPKRLDVVGILRDAHTRIAAAAPNVPQQFIAEKISEVLREIATYAVEEFTRRTGQAFFWKDEPEFEEPIDTLMSFGLDEKGNVVF